jgi:hypothetical protein
MSNTNPFDAYPLEARWKHIDAHLSRSIASGPAPRCGHIAGTYGGGIITKADVQGRLAQLSELGGSGK